MIEWSEQHLMIRDAVRRFVEEEIAPNLEELEHGDTPPYDILRKLFRTFGMEEMARSRFEKQIAKEKRVAAGEDPPKKDESAGEVGGRGDAVAMTMIPIIEICRYCPGMVTAMGVSTGLTSAAIMSKGTIEQKERWGLDLLTMDKIGAWAITEPGSGSDAFGSMKATARDNGDGSYTLNGNKTFITNGPYADTIVFICKLEEAGVDPKDRKIMNFVLDSGTKGLTQSKPMRKMGLHSSPTGELFLTDVVVSNDHLLGGKPVERKSSGAKDTFSMERAGVAAMALGMIDRCLELSLKYARERVQFGRPIGEFQLIQDKLARMEVARFNVENMVFRTIESAEKGRGISFAEASAMKLYSARAAVEVAMEAVQIYGGNGYMSEYRVEQLARDAKVLQIYAGTDEIQISSIARELLSRP
ncbi:MAG: acyl-CoA dehydrogenase family protein [Deltaproteobacteria bacterium]|nr:acyl-CoA dehydrogenase family protein [Deltaproteobacteria bacterium]MBW2723389.1 acyl-CoA dehydrogenase family protein [Deltaproteobacteria bacterium]